MHLLTLYPDILFQIKSLTCLAEFIGGEFLDVEKIICAKCFLLMLRWNKSIKRKVLPSSTSSTTITLTGKKKEKH
jgi:hypothetical protein